MQSRISSIANLRVILFKSPFLFNHLVHASPAPTFDHNLYTMTRPQTESFFEKKKKIINNRGKIIQRFRVRLAREVKWKMFIQIRRRKIS